jgi:MFS family permease
MQRILFNIVCLGIANTIPLYFATLALPTIMRSSGASLVQIGLFGSLMLPWAFKFFWAPFLDKYSMGFYGRRKTWFLFAQLMMFFLLVLICYISPQKHPELLFASVVILLICSATHYLASSAYILEQLPSHQLRFGNYANVVGTACGSFIGGGLFLLIYSHFEWKIAVLSITLISFVLCLFQFKIEEHGVMNIGNLSTPSIVSFFRRKNTRLLLYVCLVYRGCEGLVMGMQQPFLVDNHIKLSTIGEVMGISGLTVSLLASGIMSLLLKNETKCLIVLGLLRSSCYLSLAILAWLNIGNLYLIFGCVVINMAVRAMEMIVLYTIFMKNCDFKQVATDISILLCAEVIIYSLGIMLSGYLVGLLGYGGLFFLGSNLSLVTTFICAYLVYRVMPTNICVN